MDLCIGTALFYLFLVLILFLLCRKGEKSNSKKYIITAYLLLFIVFAIRFDVGNDYDQYYEAIKRLFYKARTSNYTIAQIYRMDDEGEFSFYYISWIIGKLFSSNTYYLVFAVYGFVTVYFLYKALDKYSCHSWGLLAYFFTGLLFFAWDGTRQGAALSIVLYAFTFLQEKKFLKYIIYISAAAIFHTSALIMIPVYFISYVRINKRISVSVILFVIVAFWLGVFEEVVKQASIVFSLMDNDYSKYENSFFATALTFESTNWKIRVTSYALFWISTLIAIDNEKYNAYSVLTLIGAIIFILANGSMIFYRISLYFSIVTVLVVPLSFSLFKGKLKFNKLFLLAAMSGMFLFFTYDSITGKYSRGCSPYKTIFSEDAEMLKFKGD